MVNKLVAARLRTLFDALQRASAVAERSVKHDPGVLDPSIIGRLEDLEMEVGMALADLEDGSLVGRVEVGSPS